MWRNVLSDIGVSSIRKSREGILLQMHRDRTKNCPSPEKFDEGVIEAGAKEQPKAVFILNVVHSTPGIKPYIVPLKHTDMDSNGYPCNFYLIAIIDLVSSISIIRDDLVPFHVREPVQPDILPYRGINDSKLNILNLFRDECVPLMASVCSGFKY